MKKVKRVTVREGYDLWSDSYDTTPNPVVAMDARFSLALLQPQKGELILDAGCGTGRNLAGLTKAGSRAVGLDFSLGMLRVARRNAPTAPVLQADLQQQFPLQPESFDAVLCALIGEHLEDLPTTFSQTYKTLKPGGRYVFSVYHPELAAAGKEANFEQADTEYRLGAVRHTIDDYLNLLSDAGFTNISKREYYGDEELVKAVPKAVKFLNFPVLLTIEARKV